MRYHVACLLLGVAACAIVLGLGQLLTALLMLPFTHMARTACAEATRYAPYLITVALVCGGAGWLLLPSR